MYLADTLFLRWPGVFLIAGFGAELLHNLFHQAPASEAALQQIRANKGSKPKPVSAQEQRTFGNAESEREQDECAGDDAYELPGCHGGFPFQ